MKNNETKLLNQIKIIPIFLLIGSFIISTKLTLNEHKENIKKEIEYIKSSYILREKEIINKEVNKVYNLIDFASNPSSRLSKKLTKDDIKHDVLKRIESMKYDMDGYIFIFDYKGNALININKSLLQENQLNLKDKNGLLLAKEIIKTAKKGENYISYIGLKGTHKDQSKKISFIKGFDKWGWAIGYGFHPSDIQPHIDKKTKDLNKKHASLTKKIIITNSIITIIFTMLLIWFSKNISNIFAKYKKEIKQKEEKNRKKDEIIFQQSKMASMGELITIISHQWRQPLAQINGVTLDLYMKQKMNSLKEDDLISSVKNIEDTTRYLSNTIDDFNNFFIKDIEKTDFSPKEAFEECIKILAPSLIHIEINIDEKSTKNIYGFMNLFQQIIFIILTNTLDAFKQNHIKKPIINIQISEEQEYLLIDIIDNGGGIDKDKLPKIFDLYFSTKDKQGLSGLGLYIAKNIITTTMNGDIKAQNYKNGMKFTLKV